MVSLARIEEKSREFLKRFYLRKMDYEAKKTDKLKQMEFMEELRYAQLDLEAARNNYNHTRDAGLLEYYIYEMKAAETKVNYYMKLAKQKNYCNAPVLFVSGRIVGRGEGSL